MNSSDTFITQNDSHSRKEDRFFFSPGGRRFRSRPEVVRFLTCLSTAKGDEAEAAALFQEKKKTLENEEAPAKGDVDGEIASDIDAMNQGERSYAISDKMEVGGENPTNTLSGCINEESQSEVEIVRSNKV